MLVSRNVACFWNLEIESRAYISRSEKWNSSLGTRYLAPDSQFATYEQLHTYLCIILAKSLAEYLNRWRFAEVCH